MTGRQRRLSFGLKWTTTVQGPRDTVPLAWWTAPLPVIVRYLVVAGCLTVAQTRPSAFGRARIVRLSRCPRSLSWTMRTHGFFAAGWGFGNPDGATRQRWCAAAGALAPSAVEASSRAVRTSFRMRMDSGRAMTKRGGRGTTSAQRRYAERRTEAGSASCHSDPSGPGSF